jgi:hypothetical protein
MRLTAQFMGLVPATAAVDVAAGHPIISIPEAPFHGSRPIVSTRR